LFYDEDAVEDGEEESDGLESLDGHPLEGGLFEVACIVVQVVSVTNLLHYLA
jgi:hypothetical protein